MDEQAVRLAVIAHIRHNETNYDELLAEAGRDQTLDVRCGTCSRSFGSVGSSRIVM